MQKEIKVLWALITIGIQAIHVLSLGEKNENQVMHNSCEFTSKFFIESSITILVLQNFKKFEDLNFECETNKAIQYDSIELLEIEPNIKLFLNDSLNLPRLLFKSLAEIILKNIAQIDVSSRLFDEILPNSTELQVELSHSIFEVYRGTEIVDEDTCYELMNENNKSGIFHPVTYLSLGSEVRFSSKICPVIFKITA